MHSLALIHVLLIAVWMGLVLAESVLEFSVKTPADSKLVARAHFWIDVLFELPVLSGVLITGFLLMSQLSELSALLKLKIVLAFIAIAFNFTCIVLVVLRKNAIDDDARLASLQKWVRRTGVGIPFGLAAGYLGFRLLFSQ